MGSDGFHAWLEKKFLFAERKTNFWQEFRGALATFLTMAYILLVNPQLLYKVINVSPEIVVMSTALASATGCFWAGYFGLVTILLRFIFYPHV
jgi:AGZA family xanthine/uracil permease-like MFS transporter